MKILLINASPRKGNTYNTLKKYEEKLIRDKFETEIVSIESFEIRECIGCYCCVTKGEDYCPLRSDDTIKLWRKISEVDGIVLSSPVYALGLPSGLKKFIDRIAYNAHRPSFYNKPMVSLSTTAGMGLENVFKQLRWFEIAGLRVVSEVGFMVYPNGTDSDDTLKNKDAKMEKSVRELARQINTKKTIKPKLIQVIQFYGLKLNCHFGEKVYSADCKYFSNRNFFTDIEVNPIKAILGRLIYKIGMKTLKSKISVT